MRLDLCNTGSALIPTRDGNVSFFSQNSLGDVFYRSVAHEIALDDYSIENCTTVYALDAWERAMLSQKRPVIPLAITERTDMKHIFQAFTNRGLRYDRPKEAALCEANWKHSIDELQSYVDILAPELLAVWEMAESRVEKVSTSSRDKVLDWLEMSATKERNECDYERLTPLTPVNTQELHSVSQQVIDLEENTATPETLLPRVKVNVQKRKKRINYVPGF